MYKYLSLLLVALFLLSACDQPVSLASNDSSEDLSVEDTVKEYLSNQLDIPFERLELVSIEPMEWPDSCLGLQDPDLVCLTVITPGYKVILKADGITYELHTDETAQNIVIFSSGEEPAIVTLVKNYLAKDISIEPAQIQTVFYEAVEWSDSCLGIRTEGLMCMQVITPGYRVILEANGKTYTFHTNQDGSQIELASRTDEVEAARKAREFLAKEMNIDVSSINILSVEPMEWPDGCLGLSELNMACIQVVTPGYRVILEYDGDTFIFRTDETGALVKQEFNPDVSP